MKPQASVLFAQARVETIESIACYIFIAFNGQQIIYNFRAPLNGKSCSPQPLDVLYCTVQYGTVPGTVTERYRTSYSTVCRLSRAPDTCISVILRYKIAKILRDKIANLLYQVAYGTVVGRR
jgi:hypothetical protein